jgi:hypothetical protein
MFYLKEYCNIRDMSPEMSDRITTVTPETIFLDIYNKHLLLMKTFNIV